MKTIEEVRELIVHNIAFYKEHRARIARLARKNPRDRDYKKALIENTFAVELFTELLTRIATKSEPNP